MHFYEKCCKTIDVNQLLYPLKTYSLRFLNVLFTTRKCILYNSQMYSLQSAYLYFTQTKRFGSSTPISREQIEYLGTLESISQFQSDG